MMFGISSLQAYEQGSYLILDIVETKAENPTQTTRLQIEQKYFEANISPKTSETNEVSSEFLVGLEQQNTARKTFNGSYFKDAKISLETSLFDTDTTQKNEPSFGTDTTSAFGQ